MNKPIIHDELSRFSLLLMLFFFFLPGTIATSVSQLALSSFFIPNRNF